MALIPIGKAIPFKTGVINWNTYNVTPSDESYLRKYGKVCCLYLRFTTREGVITPAESEICNVSREFHPVNTTRFEGIFPWGTTSARPYAITAVNVNGVYRFKNDFDFPAGTQFMVVLNYIALD